MYMPPHMLYYPLCMSANWTVTLVPSLVKVASEQGGEGNQEIQYSVIEYKHLLYFNACHIIS